MGYTGGTRENPTYHALGDHSEAVEIDYDPSVVSYTDLLAIFWKSFNPRNRPWSRQYRSAIFYHGEEQKRLALESKCEQEAGLGRIYTEVLPAGAFYRAEDYHQKYYLRHRPDLLKELEEVCSTDKDLVDSTAAAHINGYLAGNGSCADTVRKLEAILPPGKTRRVSELLCGPHQVRDQEGSIYALSLRPSLQ